MGSRASKTPRDRLLGLGAFVHLRRGQLAAVEVQGPDRRLDRLGRGLGCGGRLGCRAGRRGLPATTSAGTLPAAATATVATASATFTTTFATGLAGTVLGFPSWGIVPRGLDGGLGRRLARVTDGSAFAGRASGFTGQAVASRPAVAATPTPTATPATPRTIAGLLPVDALGRAAFALAVALLGVVGPVKIAALPVVWTVIVRRAGAMTIRRAMIGDNRDRFIAVVAH